MAGGREDPDWAARYTYRLLYSRQRASKLPLEVHLYTGVSFKTMIEVLSWFQYSRKSQSCFIIPDLYPASNLSINKMLLTLKKKGNLIKLNGKS